MTKSKQQLENKEQIEHLGQLNQVIIKETRRPNGSIRIQQDFSNCPTLTEQHTAHLSDINYLIQKFKPDELAAYISARSQHRREILGHDFSTEPSLQDANNLTYKAKKAFGELPEEIQKNFRNYVEFYKFIDNPNNAEKMIKLGILTPKQIKTVTEPEESTTTPTPTSKEKEKA